MDIRWKKTEQNRTALHRDGPVVWLSFAPLDDEGWLMDAFSTRLGGVSRDHLASMNLSFTRGDEEACVRENFRRFSAAAGFALPDLVCSDQTHTTNVVLVTGEDRGRGITRSKGWCDVDGMVTDVPGVVLGTFYADCVPLYFADPVHRAVGLSHSGWKGTAGKIGACTVRKMQASFGTNPKDLICVIGPSICRDCYEVGEDVAGKFPEEFLTKKENGKYQLDLWGANRSVLTEAGVSEAHIMMPELCTCCNPDFLFSHRATGGRRGNLGAFLGIRRT